MAIRIGSVLRRSPAMTTAQSAKATPSISAAIVSGAAKARCCPPAARQRDRDVTGALSELKSSPSEARLWRHGPADSRKRVSDPGFAPAGAGRG
jgi:hypothetical protein